MSSHRHEGPSEALQTALNDSITAGNFIDTKFYAFSRRASAKRGRVDKPRALYANSHVLKESSSYFDSLFSDEFSDGFDTSLACEFPIDRDPHKDGYDYYSDSDLEDADETNEDSEVKEINGGESPSQEIGTSVDASETGSQKDLSSFQPADFIAASRSSCLDLSTDLPSEGTITPQSRSSSVSNTKANRVSKTFIISYTAFKTFHAVIWYAYTGEITFSSLGSRKIETNTATESLPQPSAKSIYRFADEHKMVGLQERAFKFISTDLSQLSPCDLVEEAFSRFTSWYPAIRELIIPILCDILRTSYGSHIKLFKDKIHLYTQGELPYCADSVVAISTCFVSTRSTIPEPFRGPLPELKVYQSGSKPVVKGKNHPHHPLPLQVPLPPQDVALKEEQKDDVARSQELTVTSLASDSSDFWHILKLSIKDSLTSGSFDDVTFCVYKKSSEPRIALYCSRAMIQASSKRLFHSVTDSDIENEYDSDVEEDEKSVYTAKLSETQVSEPSTAIRVNGSVTTWSSLLWYLYTGKISFAPLCSQGIKARKERIDKWKLANPYRPAPCSPKSILTLAEKLSISGLQALAAQDIESKLQGSNIIEEMFPTFPTTNSILDIALNVFNRNTSLPGVPRVLGEKIGAMSEGTQTHTAEALTFYFDLFLATKPKDKEVRVSRRYQTIEV